VYRDAMDAGDGPRLDHHSGPAARRPSAEAVRQALRRVAFRLSAAATSQVGTAPPPQSGTTDAAMASSTASDANHRRATSLENRAIFG
jgi:hypothetical protein